MLAGVGEWLFFHVLEEPKTYEVSAEAGSPAILRFQGSHVCCNHCGKKHEWRSWLKLPLANNYDSSLQIRTSEVVAIFHVDKGEIRGASGAETKVGGWWLRIQSVVANSKQSTSFFNSATYPVRTKRLVVTIKTQNSKREVQSKHVRTHIGSNSSPRSNSRGRNDP